MKVKPKFCPSCGSPKRKIIGGIAGTIEEIGFYVDGWGQLRRHYAPKTTGRKCIWFHCVSCKSVFNVPLFYTEQQKQELDMFLSGNQPSRLKWLITGLITGSIATGSLIWTLIGHN